MNDTEEETVFYSVKISEEFYNKINEHVFLVKKLLKPNSTKSRWIQEAIQEKLNNTEEPSNIATKEKSISFYLEPMVNEKLNILVKLMKKLKLRYSKKCIVVEAIEEKLEREEKEVIEKLDEYKLIRGENKHE